MHSQSKRRRPELLPEGLRAWLGDIRPHSCSNCRIAILPSEPAALRP